MTTQKHLLSQTEMSDTKSLNDLLKVLANFLVELVLELETFYCSQRIKGLPTKFQNLKI